MTPKVREAIEKLERELAAQYKQNEHDSALSREYLKRAEQAEAKLADLERKNEVEDLVFQGYARGHAEQIVVKRALRGAQNAAGQEVSKSTAVDSQPVSDRACPIAPAPAAPDPETIKWAQEIVAAYDAHCGPYTVKCGTVAHEFLRLHAALAAAQVDARRWLKP